MLRAKKIRRDVSAENAATLEFMQGKCRGLYNWLVMRLRAGERWHFAEVKARLAECRAYDPELNKVYGKLLAEVYFRLDNDMQAFFRRIKAEETPGSPRVRPRHQCFTLCYPAAYLLFEGKRLILPTGGKGHHKRFPNILATLAEVPPCGFREVAISRDARGHYYASFVYEAPEAEPQPGQVVAFDLGIKTLAVGVNEQGRFYHIGGWKRVPVVRTEQLDKIRSKRDRCKKKSRRYIHLSQVYQRVSERKRNKRRDSLHKANHPIADKLVESTVVIGDLSGAADGHEGAYRASGKCSIAVSSTIGGCTALRRCWSTNVCWLGKSWKSSMNARRARPVAAVGTSNPCRSGSGRTAVGTVGSRWTAMRTVRSISASDSLPGSRPHTGDPVRCAAVFTATENV